MPFILMQGTFHLVSETASGGKRGFQPDGDSIHFRPANPELLNRLTRLGRRHRLTKIGSVNLRFEGIDALELHYAGGAGQTQQPRPLADQARDALTGLLRLNPVPYVPPRDITVKAPVPRDAAPGYILSRTLEVHGRPVSFAFGGQAPASDGEEVFLSVRMVRRSLNYKLLRAGHAYPLFYDGLFSDLRAAFARATRRARGERRDLWANDRSQRGVQVRNQGDLERNGVIFPKLFRRLTKYLAQGHTDLSSFPAWLAEKQEEILILERRHFTHFNDIVLVGRNRVRLNVLPEEVVFISEK